MKIVIVGSDGRKFDKEQEKKAKYFIEELLLNLRDMKDLFVSPVEILEKNGEYSIRSPVKRIEFEKLTVVSGHCPVGKELWYCVDCNGWDGTGVKPDPHPSPSTQRSHRTLKVYDKGGVDTWAEIMAKKLGIPTEIKRPEVYQFPDKIGCPNDVTHSNFACSEGCNHTKSEHRFREGDIVDCIDCEKEHKNEEWEMQVVLRRYKGYRSRNIDMAEIGTIGYTIEVAGSCRHCGGTQFTGESVCKKCNGTGAYSGGTFVKNHMKKLGKEAHQVIID